MKRESFFLIFLIIVAGILVYLNWPLMQAYLTHLFA